MTGRRITPLPVGLITRERIPYGNEALLLSEKGQWWNTARASMRPSMQAWKRAGESPYRLVEHRAVSNFGSGGGR